MADPIQAPPAAPGGSITATTASAFGLAGLVPIADWIVDCAHAGEVVPPTVEAIAVMAACLAPIGHTIYRGVLNRLNRWADAPPRAQTPSQQPIAPKPGES